mmetsp:Transcript_5480/g.19999  ORF Transcript_5480/g.19999 Transcript_5480/m.19999 type:complete len:248 (-) Transcript_5480:98-841(-)
MRRDYTKKRSARRLRKSKPVLRSKRRSVVQSGRPSVERLKRLPGAREKERKRLNGRRWRDARPSPVKEILTDAPLVLGSPRTMRRGGDAEEIRNHRPVQILRNQGLATAAGKALAVVHPTGTDEKKDPRHRGMETATSGFHAVEASVLDAMKETIVETIVGTIVGTTDVTIAETTDVTIAETTVETIAGMIVETDLDTQIDTETVAVTIAARGLAGDLISLGTHPWGPSGKLVDWTILARTKCWASA